MPQRASLAGVALTTMALTTVALASLVPSSAAAWCQTTSSNAAPTATERCVLAANHPGAVPLAWRNRSSALGLSSARPSRTLSEADVRRAVNMSFAPWLAVSCEEPTSLSFVLSPELNDSTIAVHTSGGSNVNSLMFIADGWVSDRMQDPTAYAVTYVWHNSRTGEIVGVDMEVNEARGPFAICPDTGCALGEVDLPNVLTHEAGHYFGLAHTPDDEEATMWASAPVGELQKRTLQPDDEQGLCAIYPPQSGCAVAWSSRGASASLASGLVALGLVLARRRRR